MSILVTAIAHISGSNAQFRAWGSAMQAVFETGTQAFWKKTADTGQIDWTTVAEPGANALAGYEIYKSNDTLTSSFPIYMRVDFGSGGNATRTPYLRFQFGTGTNGAGTLTGNVSPTHDHRDNTAGTTALGTTYSSAGAGRFAMFAFNANGPATQSNCPVVVERSVDLAGAYTADYFTYVIGTVADVILGFIQRTVFNPAASIGVVVPAGVGIGLDPALTLALPNVTTTAQGRYLTPFPVFPYLGFPDNCMTAAVGMKTGDAGSEGCYFDMTLYGVSKHYLWSNRGAAFLGSGAGYSNIGMGIRWE